MYAEDRERERQRERVCVCVFYCFLAQGQLWVSALIIFRGEGRDEEKRGRRGGEGREGEG